MVSQGIAVRSGLADSRFLRAIPSVDVKSILAVATPRRYLAGTVIVNQGLPADYWFLLTHGRGQYFFISQGGRKIPLMWFPRRNAQSA